MVRVYLLLRTTAVRLRVTDSEQTDHTRPKGMYFYKETTAWCTQMALVFLMASQHMTCGASRYVNKRSTMMSFLGACRKNVVCFLPVSVVSLRPWRKCTWKHLCLLQLNHHQNLPIFQPMWRRINMGCLSPNMVAPWPQSYVVIFSNTILLLLSMKYVLSAGVIKAKPVP